MAVQVHIHKTHRQFTDGQDVVAVEGDSVGACLINLVRQFPGMKSILFDKKEKLNKTIEIYVNLQSAYPKELERAVKEGDKIHITLLLAGG